jgi:6-phosphogluconolactonase/glucosamine-6-phosphate isomerase/deaminase
MSGITFQPVLVSKQIQRNQDFANSTIVLSDEAVLNKCFHKRSQSQVFNRLFLDSKKYQNMRDEKTRQFNMKLFDGLFTPQINNSQTELVTKGRQRVSSVNGTKSQERDDVFEILSKDADRRSRMRSQSLLQ